jgi:hypothetical protein
MKKNMTGAEIDQFCDEIAQHILGESMDMLHIRPAIGQALVRYAVTGDLPGGFLQAVLANDLFDAMDRADLYSRSTLYNITLLVYNKLPSNCFGSYEIVKRYIEDRKTLGPNRIWMEHIMSQYTDEDITENPQ